MVSSNASFSPRDIMEVADNTQTLFFQLYKHRSDEIAEQRVREVEKLGYKAIFLTVDAIVASNRERDIRCPWILEDEENGGPTEFHVENTPSKDVNILGTAGALIANDDIDMTWEKASTPCTREDSFFSHLSILDHSVATKDIQTSHRYQRSVFRLRSQNGLTTVIICRHTMRRGLGNDTFLLTVLKTRNRMQSLLLRPA